MAMLLTFEFTGSTQSSFINGLAQAKLPLCLQGVLLFLQVGNQSGALTPDQNADRAEDRQT